MSNKFYEGYICEGVEHLAESEWCNANGCYLEEIESAEDGTRRFQIVAIPETTFDELQNQKLEDLSNAFQKRTSGSFTTSAGYAMQFSPTDSLMVEGALRLLEASGSETGYLTQADDTTIYDVPIATIQETLTEMLSAYAKCHAEKQAYRTQILACETQDDLDAVSFSWSIDQADE